MSHLTGSGVLGKRVLITGEVGVGKTRLTARLLEEIVEAVGGENVTAIDMAPTTVPGVGARLSAYTDAVKRIRYLAPPVVRAPRLEGRSAEEVLRLAEANRAAIEPLLELYLSSPTPVLVINDLTIYLHAGDVARVVRAMGAAETFLANAYGGTRLSDDKGSGLSERERRLLELLSKLVDLVVKL